MATDHTLENDFHREMLQLYHDAKRLDIKAKRFLSEVQTHGGVGAAKRFLNKGDPWDPGQLEGIRLLIMAEGGMKNLQYTAEALVVRPQYRSLFTEEERKKACARLKAIDPLWSCE